MNRLRAALSMLAAAVLCACGEPEASIPTLGWYVFDEPSGAFVEAARRCSADSAGDYRIEVRALPSDASQQREQLVRRLAAADPDIDLIGMDVIWTAEFAQAGWILAWSRHETAAVSAGRLAATVESASHAGRLWAAPFTTNTQLLWYRSDRVQTPPRTWDEMIEHAEALGEGGAIAAQGERYEGFTVFFVSLLASAGGSVLDAEGERLALQTEPTLRVLALMRRLGRSKAALSDLPNAREDQSRLAFEAGRAAFMLNYTYVWPSAARNAPQVAARMRWARWPAVDPRRPSRVALGGINIGVGAFTRHPRLAFAAAACLVSLDNQRRAAVQGGLPPTASALYDDPEVVQALPFAATLRETLRDAVQRPRTPLYSDVSLAIARTLHPMHRIEPERDLDRLREALRRALSSRGLL
ncbi:MAG: ABC transporter substrate-binding protein [Gammaproteobacteria bacterium]|nr:ABC transporter substrate-binding protein [Gammaproteobacteria bacterium]